MGIFNQKLGRNANSVISELKGQVEQSAVGAEHISVV